MKSKVNIDPRILIVIFIMVTTTLACQIFAGGPQAPSNEIYTSDNADNSVEQILESAIRDQDAETMAFTLSQDQITAFVAEKLAANPDIPIRSPQIILENGQADIYGRLEQSVLTANFHITMKPVVEPSGKLSLEISDADFGPLPLPQVLLDTISTSVNSFISDSFKYRGTHLRIDEIFISDGFVTIEGAVQQD